MKLALHRNQTISKEPENKLTLHSQVWKLYKIVPNIFFLNFRISLNGSDSDSDSDCDCDSDSNSDFDSESEILYQ